jgi:hypothetical protein
MSRQYICDICDQAKPNLWTVYPAEPRGVEESLAVCEICTSNPIATWRQCWDRVVEAHNKSIGRAR